MVAIAFFNAIVQEVGDGWYTFNSALSRLVVHGVNLANDNANRSVDMSETKETRGSVTYSH